MKKMVNKYWALSLTLLLVSCASTEGTLQSAQPAAPTQVSMFTEEVGPELAQVQAMWTNWRCADPKEAIHRLDAILAQNPQQPLALTLRGLARSELKEREEAFEDMTTALQLRPTAEAYALRGLVLWRNGKARGAELDAVYAQRNGQEPLALMVQGLALKEQEKLSEACPLLEQACKDGQCFGLEEARKVGQCK